MCRQCDNLHREIALTRELSAELTDPTSVALNKADVKALEEKLTRLVAERHPFAPVSSRLRN